MGNEFKTLGSSPIGEPTVIDGMIFYSGKQFLNLKVSVDWLLEGYVQRGSLGLFVAPPKERKTTLMLALGGALSTGGVFLEKQCKKSRVVFLCLEGGDSSLIQTAKDMKLEETGDFFITTCKPKSIENPLDTLKKIIIHLNPDIIFIDPMMKWHPFEEKSYNSSVRILGEYSDLAKEYNIAIFFIHHSPKSSENGHDGVNGSVGIWGTADSKFQLVSRNNISYFYNDQRNAKDTPPRPIFIDRENGTVSFTKAPSGPEIRIRDEILALLKDSKEPVRLSRIKDITGKAETITEILDELIDEEIIDEISIKGRGAPLAYALKTTGPYRNLTEILDHPMHTKQSGDLCADFPTKEELEDCRLTKIDRV